jgi:hypothetical protein
LQRCSEKQELEILSSYASEHEALEAIIMASVSSQASEERQERERVTEEIARLKRAIKRWDDAYGRTAKRLSR